MAKKKKRNRKPAPKKQVRLKPENFVKKRARQYPLGKCYMNSDWQESGMATVIVTRKMRNGDLIVGSFVVDVFCLGVKDTFFRINLPQFMFDEEFLPLFTDKMQLDMEVVESTLAFNVIYGAVEYAEDLGFNPHKDFRITEYILDDVEGIEYVDIEFGKDGKPFYISGPHDDIEKIAKTLDKSVGKDNYEITVNMGGGDFLDFDEGGDFEDDEDDEEEYDDYEEVK